MVMILAWVVFGFVVGAVARALYPGSQPIGFLGTTAIGIVGSFVGGVLGSVLFDREIVTVHPAGLIGSIVGALVVLAVAGATARRAKA